VAENPRIEELRRRVQADPASIAFAALAEEFRRTGRYADAIETCRAGLQRHPAYLSARVTLGRALIETGDYEAARQELETVLSSAPENIAARRGIEQIHERLGHSTEMHPDLHAMMEEPIRLAAERPPAPPPGPPPPAPIPFSPPQPVAPLDLSAFKIEPLVPDPGSRPDVRPTVSLDHVELIPPAASEPEDTTPSQPFDIFAAALTQRETPSPVPVSLERRSVSPPIDVLQTDEAPSHGLDMSEAPAVALEPPMPDPHVAATLVRLERFLGAIQSARHA
jgi:tetratricopeptide (TPR) repeat protein